MKKVLQQSQNLKIDI